MRVLAFDPGAERCGYCCLETGPVYVGSGINGLKRESIRTSPTKNKLAVTKSEPYQGYRLKLIDFWTKRGVQLLDEFKPDEVVSETVPAVGGGNFIVAAQGALASTAITVIQCLCFQKGIPVKQIGATTVKTKIGGKKDATKVKVRDGVLSLMPEQAHRAKEWTKVFDESDAYAIALAYLGYSANSGTN
jgi:Holliday junction resolvasome RuvABC endonuclease subunit